MCDPSAITQNNTIVFLFLLKHTVRFYSSVTCSKSLFVPYFYCNLYTKFIGKSKWLMCGVRRFLDNLFSLIKEKYQKGTGKMGRCQGIEGTYAFFEIFTWSQTHCLSVIFPLDYCYCGLPNCSFVFIHMFIHSFIHSINQFFLFSFSYK